jgi:peptide-methionine (R)-S-oxide reductase
MLTWNDVTTLAQKGNANPPARVEKSDSHWQRELSDDVYRITRGRGTERPFSSEMCALFEPGRYQCACCATVLFDAGTKFDSGTGWPSFTQPIEPNVVAYVADPSHGMTRIETVCAVCDAHLGHVFPDGPKEGGGLRYCINALSLQKASP